MRSRKWFDTLLHLLSLPGGAPSSGEYTAYFSRLPVITTPSLILRPMRMSDAQDIFSYSSDPEVARYVLWDPHRNLRDTRAYIRYIRSLYRNALPSSWAVVLQETGRVVGSVGFMWVSPENASAEVGYSYARPVWNRGTATEALAAVLDSAFRSLPLNRIEAQRDLRNPASGRVMEKCGMTQEGILRGRLKNKGEYVDVALSAILRADWEARMKSFH